MRKENAMIPQIFVYIFIEKASLVRQPVLKPIFTDAAFVGFRSVSVLFWHLSCIQTGQMS